MIVTTQDYAILAAAAYYANRGEDNKINVISDTGEVSGTGFYILPQSISNNSTNSLSGASQRVRCLCDYAKRLPAERRVDADRRSTIRGPSTNRQFFQPVILSNKCERSPASNWRNPFRFRPTALNGCSGFYRLERKFPVGICTARK